MEMLSMTYQNDDQIHNGSYLSKRGKKLDYIVEEPQEIGFAFSEIFVTCDQTMCTEKDDHF
jgi:hypothetical protein